MKKEYITPRVSVEDLEQDSVMIQFSLQTGDDDEDEAGAKKSNFIFNDDIIEESESPGSSSLLEMKEPYIE